MCYCADRQPCQTVEFVFNKDQLSFASGQRPMTQTAAELFNHAEQLNAAGQLTEARGVLLQATNLGHAPAAYRLALAESMGLGGDRDTASALARVSAIDAAYPPARMLRAVATAAGWHGSEDWASAVSLMIGYAQANDPAALFDLGTLCLLRGGEHSEGWAQSLFASALKLGAQFAAPALMRMHAMRGEAFLPSPATLKALEQARFFSIGDIERHARQQKGAATPPGLPPALDALQQRLSPPPSTWGDTNGETVAEAISAKQWSGRIHPCICDFLIGYAGPSLAPAEVQDPTTGQLIQHPVRRALQANLGTFRQTLTIHALEQILARKAGLPWANTENLTVLFYREGDYYAPHADFFSETADEDVAQLKESGQREATSLLSLRPADEGGATYFPHLKTAWNGKIGDVLVFRNLTHYGKPNPVSWHEGQVVTGGWKALASLWVRARAYHGD